MLPAGRLRYTISFLKPDGSRGQSGAQNSVWSVNFSVRADIQFVKGIRVFMAGDAWNPQDLMITCRYDSRMDNAQRIRYGSHDYYIGAPNVDEKEGSAPFTATLINE